MKTKNFLFAGAIALSTVLSPAAALLNAAPVSAETVTVKDGWGDSHTFKAFQIFKGTQGPNGILGDIEWGDGVNGDALLAAINADSELTALHNAGDAKGLAKKLENVGNDSPVARKFAKLAFANKVDSAGKEIKKGVNENFPAGYYLIVDTTANMSAGDYAGLSILQLTGTEGGIVIDPKNSAPSVDKQVQDEENEGSDVSDTNQKWDETADHAIGETFKFKIIASGIDTDTINNYDSYYLQMVDTYSDGVTYKGNVVVKIKVGTANERVLSDDKYQVQETDHGLTITFTDLKGCINDGETGAIVVTATYDAQLNENAKINSTDDLTIGNQNTVKLIYSNNPDTTGKGETEEDHVFVASFKLTNVKKAGTENGDNLEGAEFKLTRTLPGGQKQVAEFKKVTKDGNELNYFDKWVNYNDETELKGENAKGTAVVSDANGDFSMYGLDAGTYALVETKAPDGYNTAANKTVIIDARHSEQPGGTSAVVALEEGSSFDSTVVDTQNGTLPETGGMGTTMLYTTGALLVAGAAITYVTNKRMKRED